MRIEKSILISLSVVFTLLSGMCSCNKLADEISVGFTSSPFKDTFLLYKQSQCTDVWGYGKTDSVSALMACSYLDTLHLLD